MALLFALVVLLNGRSYITAVIWFAIAAILFIKLPIIHQKFKEKTYENLDYKENSTRITAVICSFLIVFAGIFTSLIVVRAVNISMPSIEQNKVVEEENGVDDTEENVVKAASIIIQNRLKNPLSLIVNGYKVELISSNSAYFTYSVEVDYSAQNGFGGMNRETDYITIKYDLLERMYYYGSTKIILD